MILFVVVVLDSMYRLKYVKFWFREWYGKDKGDEMSSKVRDVLKRLYMKKVSQNGVSSSSGSGSVASLARDSRPSVDKVSLSDRIKSYNNRFKQHLAGENSVESKSKWARYLLESFEDPNVEDFDILMWWKMNYFRYRVLSQIARDVLAIPISTVASEFAFSIGGVFWIRSVAHYLLIQLNLLFVPRIG